MEVEIPDLLKKFSNEIYSEDNLCKKSMEFRMEFVYSVISTFAQQCGGIRFFWCKEDEKFIFDGWVQGLANFKIKNIITAVILILDCKYKKRDDFIPRNVIDFKHFIIETKNINLFKNDSNNPDLRLEYDIEDAEKRAEEARKIYMEKIRKILPKMYLNVKH
jgi:hypothetical protein